MMAQFSPQESDRHRQLFKRTTPPWKETYRMRCLSRFRQSRERLVDTFRRFNVLKIGNGDEKEIPEIMDQEWDAIQREEVFNGIDSMDELVALKSEIYLEILEEEQRIVSEYELSLDDSSGRHDSSMAKELSDVHVLCPLCQRSRLVQTGNVIHCLCGLHIDTEWEKKQMSPTWGKSVRCISSVKTQDCLTLSDLHQQLAVGLEGHNSACSANPQFSQMNTFGISNLLITCSSCDFMFIVI